MHFGIFAFWSYPERAAPLQAMYSCIVFCAEIAWQIRTYGGPALCGRHTQKKNKKKEQMSVVCDVGQTYSRYMGVCMFRNSVLVRVTDTYQDYSLPVLSCVVTHFKITRRLVRCFLGTFQDYTSSVHVP